MKLKIDHKKIRKRTIVAITTIIFLLTFSVFFVHAFPKTVSKLEGEKITYKTQIKSLSGPWGDLEIDPMIVQAKADYFTGDADFKGIIDIMKASNHWTFKDLSLEEIRSLFSSAGLKSEVCNELLNNTKPLTGDKGYVTTPPDSILWNFTAKDRANLYPLIGKYEGNLTYTSPYYFVSDNIDEWLYNSSLSKELADKLRMLIYSRKGELLISDIHLLAPYLKSDEDWCKLLQTIYRTPSLNIYLKVKHRQDVNSLIEYWGSFNQSARTIIENLSKNPEGGRVNILDLLPQIPKDRLNTFTSIKETSKAPKDCIWTMYNFFNKQEDERYLNQQAYLKSISQLSKDKSKLKFGDIIYLADKNNNILHSCIYIADNIVYTKNGENSNITISPFILSYFDKTTTLYGFNQEHLNIVYCIRRIGDTSELSISN